MSHMVFYLTKTELINLFSVPISKPQLTHEKPQKKQSDVHTITIQSLQQQSDKAHCHHQEQRAHHHGSTGSTNSGSTTKNFRTLAAGDRWVVWIAVVRCSIVTHYIGKIFCCVPTKILKANKKDKRRLHV